MADTLGDSSAGGGPGEAWPAAYWRLALIGLVVCLVISLLGFVSARGGGSEYALALTYLVLPIAFGTFLLLARKGGSRYLLLATILLDVETLFVSALFAVGLAYAILFPLIGLAILIDSVRGRITPPDPSERVRPPARTP